MEGTWCSPTLTIINLASAERRECFGNRRVSRKEIAEGKGEKRTDTDKRIKMVTDRVEGEKNVQEKKKDELTYKARDGDIEHVLETQRCFRGDLRSFWGAVAKKLL